ncbi:hypothetical protein P7H19_23035 [Paenibacillus larvae]|nr:hypothetical protein [Paenibacillus larvae]MDT2238587.1 hypothetical protein [Paenibacillus larvae]
MGSRLPGFSNSCIRQIKTMQGDDLDKELQEAVKQARNEVKDAVFRIKEEIFTRTQEEYKDELKRTAPVLHHLVRLVDCRTLQNVNRQKRIRAW